MSTELTIRQRLRRIAAERSGLCNRDIQNRITSASRGAARVAMKAMISAGELHEAAAPYAPHWFLTADAAAAWIADGRPGRPIQKRPTVPGTGLVSILESQVGSAWRVKGPKKEVRRQGPVVPEIGPCAQVYSRHQLTELPAGYVSELNPSECRPWALAAASR